MGFIAVALLKKEREYENYEAWSMDIEVLRPFPIGPAFVMCLVAGAELCHEVVMVLSVFVG
jgi:hypothetical protein